MSNLISVFTNVLVIFSQTDIFLYLLGAFALFGTIQLIKKAVYG